VCVCVKFSGDYFSYIFSKALPIYTVATLPSFCMLFWMRAFMVGIFFVLSAAKAHAKS